MNANFTIKTAELLAYMQGLKWSDFEYPNSTMKPAILIKDAIDADFNKKDVSTDQYVFLGQPYLCDALGGDLSILICTKRKFRLPTGRVITAALHSTIIDNTNKTFGDWLNGYWAIPPQFISYTPPYNYIYSIAKIIGVVPTAAQRDKWLNQLAKQWNAELCFADKLHFNFEADKDMLTGLVMKLKNQNSHLGPIFNGIDENEKRWNMLEHLFQHKYAKYEQGKSIAILFV